ncbi:Rho GTPase activating protein [Entomophthora muscae]|uniref:Rho GTPase activating protein n=1 Tax=Entomophthora muscae TaxID=34485 RepID=A0ACC2TP04_9FUNG|nr:Rho GTPase activating protein [Entomophthora muscae]
MILEPKRGTQGTLRHVLCADSDAERDEWVNAIGYHFMGDMQPPPPPIPEAEADSQLSSDHSLSPTTQDPPITDKAESIGIINNQSTASIGSLSSANSDSRPSEVGQLPLPNRSVSKPEESAVINIPNAMPKILKEGPPKPARKTFWGKRIFSGDSAKNKPPQQPVFGVPLHQSVQASRVLEGYALSSVVYRCIQYLDSKQAQFEEGIYRLSGSSATIRMLRTKFDTEGDYGLVDSGVYYDVHAISGLLKLYLRELPSTVLTAELHRDFLQITELPSRRLRVRKLGRLICSLPIENYTLLRALIGHLIVIVQEADTNKMPLKNIVIVFAPTLGIPAGVFSLLLSEFKYVFYIDPEGTAIPQELSGEDDTPPPTPVTQEAAPSELNERDVRRARHRHTASADTVMELAKGVSLLLGESQNSGPEEDGLPPDLNESRRSKRNSVIYRNRAPPEIVRLERQAEESLTNREELTDDLVLES